MSGEFFSDPVVLVPFRAEWEDLAQAEMGALRAALHGVPVIDLQHFGSTAIRGIAAKPILDVQVLVSSAECFPAAVAAIRALGYEYWEANPNRAQLFFVKGRPPAGTGRTHHVHVLYDAEKFEDALLFRDALNGDPGLAKEYEDLKRELAQRFANDREAYTEGKTDFVRDVIRNARWATA
jgi:GrpB-like predicted nucleotidyltransferase (UPF0157 family)